MAQYAAKPGWPIEACVWPVDGRCYMQWLLFIPKNQTRRFCVGVWPRDGRCCMSLLFVFRKAKICGFVCALCVANRWPVLPKPAVDIPVSQSRRLCVGAWPTGGRRYIRLLFGVRNVSPGDCMSV